MNRPAITNITRDSIIMVITGGISGAFTYLYQLLLGFFLDPEEYGIFLSLSSIFIIFTFFSQSVSLTTANYVSMQTSGSSLGIIRYIRDYLLKRYLVIGVLLFFILCGLTPIITRFLNIENYLYPILIFTTVIFTFILAGNWGILQGMQKFIALGINQLLWGLLRPLISTILIFLNLGLIGGIIALPLSFAFAFFFSLVPLRYLNKFDKTKTQMTNIVLYGTASAIAMLSVTVLVNLDVILVRHYLAPDEAGFYSMVAVLGRVVYYIPNGIAFVMFPKIVEAVNKKRNHFVIFRMSIILTFLLVLFLCGLYFLLSNVINQLVSESTNPYIRDYLFKYSLSMGCFALLFIIVTYMLSLNRKGIITILVAEMILQIILIVMYHDDVTQIINVMLFCGVSSLILCCPFIIRKPSSQGYVERSSQNE